MFRVYGFDIEHLELPPKMVHGLREIDVNPPVIDEHIVHFEEGGFS